MGLSLIGSNVIPGCVSLFFLFVFVFFFCQATRMNTTISIIKQEAEEKARIVI